MSKSKAKYVLFILFLLFVFLLSRVDFLKEQTNVTQNIPDAGNELLEQLPRSQFESESSALQIVRIPPDSRISVRENHDEPKFVSGWLSAKEGVVINGGYFHPDHTPSGFLVADGERIGSRMFDQDKSGLFGKKDGNIFIRDLEKHPIQDGEHFDFAIQSFPFLIKNGKPAVSVDSGKVARRSAVGVDHNGDVYLIVSDSGQLSLFQFAQLLADMNVDFLHVLNLDGGPSSGLISDVSDINVYIDSYTPVPSVIVVSIE